MASGSSGRHNSGSKAFDFGTDDILCSYEDYDSTAAQSDPTNSSKEMNKSRLTRPSVSPSSAYNSSPQEESSSNNQQEILIGVERTMKKHTDNLMRFLEGISSRLSQLELYCYNLDKSISEIRADLARDHTESDSKLKSLDKHIQEVHRSLQVLRDKQEVAETQKELTKFQHLSVSHTHSEGRSSPSPAHAPAPAPAPTPDKVNTENAPDPHNNHQLALALPPNQQLPPQQQQQQTPPPYYLSPPTHPQYHPSPSSQPSPMPHIHQLPPQQYHQPPPQQWSPQQQQQQQQIRQPSANTLYPPYVPSQTGNPALPEPIQMQFSGSPQSGSTQPELPYPYGRAGQPPPQQVKSGYGTQSAEGGYPYMMYDAEGGRPQQQQQQLPGFHPGGSGGGNLLGGRPGQLPRNHPYNELIEKLASMGFRVDHVVAVIQRIEESGQQVDFNSVLDRLNGGHSSGGGPQRGWQN